MLGNGKQWEQYLLQATQLLEEECLHLYGCLSQLPLQLSSAEDEEEEEMVQVEKLRKVVAGGKGMDICSLLEETADFVRCLHTQLSLMQPIAHHFSNS
ncbi:transcription factor IBH1 [Senna tora]|uniref:Transcription factor IBH1 n=1 Tax=Senna tora TaxID=362788 RepID=A0A834X3U5_9FABA|nr:transcription factor IBH1 [Senna tora]